MSMSELPLLKLLIFYLPHRYITTITTVERVRIITPECVRVCVCVCVYCCVCEYDSIIYYTALYYTALKYAMLSI